MKFVFKAIICFMIFFLSVLAFDTEQVDRLVTDNGERISATTHDIFDCGFVAAQSNFVYQRNAPQNINFARRIFSGGFQFFSQSFTKESSTLDNKRAICSRDGRLIIGGKPQSQYYIYALRRIRI